MSGKEEEKIYYLAGSADELLEEMEKNIPIIHDRINATPENVESGLAKLVLTVIELLRQLIEKQAMKRIEDDSLTEEQIEKLGETLMKLEKKMNELKVIFNLKDQDLNINLGPLGDLL
jgi:hypothetical protein